MDEYHVKEQVFRMALQKNIDASQSGRRDVTDVIRTALWYVDVKNRLAASTAFAVEYEIEPKAVWQNEYGAYLHNNKWRRYMVGQNTPCKSLVAKVEIKLPGTEKFLNHVLWKSLNTAIEIEGKASTWLRQLDPDIQKIVFQEHRYGLGNIYELPIPNRRQLKMLERRAGFDALACLTILLRNSCLQDDSSQAFEIARSVHRVLIILCTTYPLSIFANELFDIYLDRIYSIVKHKRWKFSFESFDFMEAAHHLRESILILEDRKQIGTKWNDRVRAMCKILDGAYGFEIMFALNIPIEAHDV